MFIAPNTRWPATASRAFKLAEYITKCENGGFYQSRSHILCEVTFYYCQYTRKFAKFIWKMSFVPHYIKVHPHNILSFLITEFNVHNQRLNICKLLEVSNHPSKLFSAVHKNALQQNKEVMHCIANSLHAG